MELLDHICYWISSGLKKLLGIDVYISNKLWFNWVGWNYVNSGTGWLRIGALTGLTCQQFALLDAWFHHFRLQYGTNSIIWLITLNSNSLNKFWNCGLPLDELMKQSVVPSKQIRKNLYRFVLKACWYYNNKMNL